MRESSPNQFTKTAPGSGLEPIAKSLFRNILAPPPYSSRFCPDRLIPILGNFKQTGILGFCSKKSVQGHQTLQSAGDDCQAEFGRVPGESKFSLARSKAAS
jgi:hypothetical protein